jgi:DNA-binding NarL/FixJ family response regulator
MSAPIRILVVDDHPVVRDGMFAMLSTQDDFEVVGTARNAEEALRLARNDSPQVVLMDLKLPGIDGAEATARLLALDRSVGVIVFTAFESDPRLARAMQAGAKGYVLKGAPRLETFRAIRTVFAGGTLVSTASGPHVEATVLTPRQAAVMELLAAGALNKQIADALGVSERTVKFHLRDIYQRLGVTNRTQAVLAAIDLGLVASRI